MIATRHRVHRPLYLKSYLGASRRRGRLLSTGQESSTEVALRPTVQPEKEMNDGGGQR
jgi:hypothetical protein